MSVEQRRRSWIVAGGLAVVVLAVVAAGFALVRDRDGTNQNANPSPSPTKSLAPEAEVEEAYLRYWEIYNRALLELDPSLLSGVAAGDALEVLTTQVEEQRKKNQPVRGRVDHNYRITIVDATTASVDDEFVDHAVRLDPKTMQPIEPDPRKRVRISHTLKKVDRTWKVTFLIGYSSPSPS
jgi:hypothetical protein